jgi:hypothetical protein
VSKQSDRAWSDYSERFRQEAFPKIASSAVAVSIIGSGAGIDVKQASELGAMLLLDKPLILVCLPGATISARLRRAADLVIEDWSPDNHDAQERLTEALGTLAKQIEGEPC